MRLIDGDGLWERLNYEPWEHNADRDEIALPIVNAAPTVDAVPVVRCKDCKYYRNHPNGLCYLHTEPKENERGYSGEEVCVEPDDFCSYGERREE
ncbi:MAG: hypothetical protein PUF20_10855 [Clostridiales bacterium]|nr:hypothetical protein [Clostridiales bacterium]